MKLLLSIRPEFAERILDGSKKYEYRRVLFRRPVATVVLYASSPVRMIVGEFEVADLIEADVDALWRMTEAHAGLSKERFEEYFRDRSRGYAIRVGRVRRYPRPVPLAQTGGRCPPQSFQYLPSTYGQPT